MTLEADLVRVINTHSKDAGLDALILPATKYLASTDRSAVSKLTHYTTAHEKLVAETQEAIANINLRSRAFERIETKLREELRDALPLEKIGIEKEIANIRSLYEETRRGRNKLIEPIVEINTKKNDFEILRKREQEFLGDIISLFPHAQIIDLSCLALVRSANGLPALGLFSVHNQDMMLSVNERHTSASTCVYPAINIPLPPSVTTSLGASIQQAVGVKLGYSESIELRATFPSGKKLIPHVAREMVRCALASELFTQVVLLTEIEQWSVLCKVRDSFFNPKIEGAIIVTPKTDDPLIVGIKSIGTSVVAVLLGAFDTTPIENYVSSEFSTKST